MTKKKLVVLALGAVLIVACLVAASERNMQIVASKDVREEGVYSNLALISHQEDQFVLDFLFIDPQEQTEEGRKAYLVARVILSPQHMKRLYNAISDSIDKYETNFGSIHVR